MTGHRVVHRNRGLRGHCRMRFPIGAIVLAASLLCIPVAGAKPLCVWGEPERTLIEEHRQASVVVTGTFTNPRYQGKGGDDAWMTDFEIDQVIKSNEIIQGVKKFTVDEFRDYPKVKFLLFCDVFKGRIDPYRAIPLSNASELVKYFSGGLRIKDQPIRERMAYCFPYLHSKEHEVSVDAFREFNGADYKDCREMARTLDPDLLVSWLNDGRTPPAGFRLYSLLLGHCGKAPKHSEFLRRLIDDTDRHKGSGRDGMMIGYVMLQPKIALQYLEKDIITNPKAEFPVQYCALKTLEFLWSERPDVIAKNELLRVALLAAETPEVADFVIEDLRKWKRWEFTDQVLGLGSRKSHDVGVIRRAVLRFALQSPMPSAKEFVAIQRKRDPEAVRDTEEFLELELPAAASRAK
jgi:hypothetical protein